MPEQPSKDEIILRYVREIAAHLIAAVILIGFALIMWGAYAQIGNADNYHQAKDLLLLFQGLVGVVMGYYFNRVTTEKRAEKAESEVRRVAESHRDALRESGAAKEAAGLARAELQNFFNAARSVLAAADRQTRGAAEAADDFETDFKNLQEAADRAETFLTRRETPGITV
jgi:hypothetical protein